MLQGDTKLKLENAFRDKKKVHYALQFGNKQHIICIYPQTLDSAGQGIKCKIMKCECVIENKYRSESNAMTVGVFILPKAGEKMRLSAYKCDYYSNTHILLKRNQIVYLCGCSTGMWDVLEERLKNTMEET